MQSGLEYRSVQIICRSSWVVIMIMFESIVVEKERFSMFVNIYPFTKE